MNSTNEKDEQEKAKYCKITTPVTNYIDEDNTALVDPFLFKIFKIPKSQLNEKLSLMYEEVIIIFIFIYFFLMVKKEINLNSNFQ
jgi:hypothetical protein